MWFYRAHIEIKSPKFGEEIWSGLEYLNIHLHMDETTRMIDQPCKEWEEYREVLGVHVFHEYITSSNYVLDLSSRHRSKINKE